MGFFDRFKPRLIYKHQAPAMRPRTVIASRELPRPTRSTPAAQAALRNPATRAALSIPVTSRVASMTTRPAYEKAMEAGVELSRTSAAVNEALVLAQKEAARADSLDAKRDRVSAQLAKQRAINHLERARVLGKSLLRNKVAFEKAKTLIPARVASNAAIASGAVSNARRIENVVNALEKDMRFRVPDILAATSPAEAYAAEMVHRPSDARTAFQATYGNGLGGFFDVVRKASGDVSRAVNTAAKSVSPAVRSLACKAGNSGIVSEAGTYVQTKAAGTPTTAPIGSQPTVRRGSRGQAVIALQQKIGVAPADGIFGPGTERAVKAFQAARGITADGVVGPATWSALTNMRGLKGLGQTESTGVKEQAVQAAIDRGIPAAQSYVQKFLQGQCPAPMSAGSAASSVPSGDFTATTSSTGGGGGGAGKIAAIGIGLALAAKALKIFR